MGESERQHLKDLLESFDTAMLITRHGEREHARPMAIASVEGENTLWFATLQDAPKSDEIRQDAHASATLQSSGRYVALSGTASLVDDRARIHELWRPTWKAWFPNGKDDPNLVLIRLSVKNAEFWDNAGAKGIRYAFEVAKALVKGREPAPVASVHGRVEPGDGGEPLSERH